MPCSSDSNVDFEQVNVSWVLSYFTHLVSLSYTVILGCVWAYLLAEERNGQYSCVFLFLEAMFQVSQNPPSPPKKIYEGLVLNCKLQFY